MLEILFKQKCKSVGHVSKDVGRAFELCWEMFWISFKMSGGYVGQALGFMSGNTLETCRKCV